MTALGASDSLAAPVEGQPSDRPVPGLSEWTAKPRGTHVLTWVVLMRGLVLRVGLFG